MTPAELREARRQRGWRLEDVALALGTTVATLSRWERGLQAPSAAALDAWNRIFSPKPDRPLQPRAPRRRPRGVLAQLADLFLTDVRAGRNGWDAGWCEPASLGLQPDDVTAFGEEIEADDVGRVRISFNSRFQAVEEGKDVLGYRRTVDAERRLLMPAIERIIRPTARLARTSEGEPTIVGEGITFMIRTGAPVVETARSLLESDPRTLFEFPGGAVNVILQAVGIAPIVHPASPPVAASSCAGPHTGIAPLVDGAESVAKEIGLDLTAQRLGREVVVALGSAWSITSRLESAGVAVVTDQGLAQLSRAFWEEIGLQRSQIDSAWRRALVDEQDTADEKLQLGNLLWSWPEAL
ncbi:MAG: helix-turn-helix transcriptional regulator [Phycisphaerales bacterium]